MNTVPRVLLVVMGVVMLLPTACSAALKTGEFGMFRGGLVRGTSSFTIEAVHVPGLGGSGGTLEAMVPAMARIALAGGNTVCFDLEGFNADGTVLSAEGIETVRAIAERGKDQRMGTMVRVLPRDNMDPAFRRNAAITAARALGGELKAVYWIDGPDADKLARDFKRNARDAVVAAPARGDLTVIDTLPEKQPKSDTIVYGQLPTVYGNWGTHYVLKGEDADYAALDRAKMTETEKNPPVFDVSILSEEEQAEGFVPIFDGETLDGWWYFGHNENTFKVNEKGEIEYVMTGGSAIKTAKRYGNFVLRLEWSIEEGGNSGIFLRAPRAARQSKIGMEFQLLGDYGEEPSDDSTGALYKVSPALVNASKPARAWNTVEIIADGPRIKATLNGVAVQDVNLDDIPELKYRLREGFIGLQDHNSWVAFRNIRIKELD